MKELYILVVILFAIVLSGCEDICGSSIISSKVSPNGDKKAVVFLYDCGATTGFSTQVSILNSDESVTTSGNILTTQGKNNFELYWASDSKLIIYHSQGIKKYLQLEKYDGIDISLE